MVLRIYLYFGKVVCRGWELSSPFKRTSQEGRRTRKNQRGVFLSSRWQLPICLRGVHAKVKTHSTKGNAESFCWRNGPKLVQFLLQYVHLLTTFIPQPHVCHVFYTFANFVSLLDFQSLLSPLCVLSNSHPPIPPSPNPNPNPPTSHSSSLSQISDVLPEIHINT